MKSAGRRRQASSDFNRCSSPASLASFSFRCAVLVASASDGSCRSAVSSWLRYRATLSFICASRRSIFARVKFLSRVLTALNLLPSMATLGVVNSPSSRQSATNRAHTLRIAGPLSLRKSEQPPRLARFHLMLRTRLEHGRTTVAELAFRAATSERNSHKLF